MAQATPSPLHDLTAFQRDVLAAIAGLDEPNGLEVKEVLDYAYAKEIHHGRIYPAFDDLVDMGLVEKGSIDARTNSYTLTPRGRRELAAHQAWTEKAMAGEV